MLAVGRRLAAVSRLAILSTGALTAGHVQAQVVERHLPPTPEAGPVTIGEPAVPIDANADDRPIGVQLTGIAVLSADEPIMPARSGVHFAALAPPRQAALVRELTPFLDQPLTRAMIGKIVATVVRSYRRAGRPFLAVTTPAQELTGGTLALRVIEFSAGKLTVRTPSAAVAARAAAQVRFRPGARIDARALRQDLTWLDRYPFRQTNALFSASEERGTTDLMLDVAAAKAWQLFGGISTSDAPSSGQVRYFAGAQAGGLIGPDSLVSAQATTSGFEDPAYLGIAARVTKPWGARREITLLAGFVRGHTTTVPFASSTRTAQASLDLRFALPPALLGDGHVGIEVGRQWLDARFGGASIYTARATTLALVVGYSAAVPIPDGTLSLDATLHFSPGGIGGGNQAARLFFGRPGGGSATYAYATADVAMTRRVARRLEWQARLLTQVSAAPLPPLAQVGLGGSTYVRGYTLDDGGYDTAAVIRNALRLRSSAVAGISPQVFMDWGTGRYLGRARETFGSIGTGLEQRLGRGLALRVEVALPLLDGVRTAAFKPRVIALLSALL